MPILAPGQVLWRGDFATGNVSQWSGTLNPATGGRDNITIVDSPVFAGKHAARIVVHPDDTFPNGHNRVELRYDGKRTAEGQTTFFAWRFLLPANIQVHEDIGYWETKGPDYRQSMAFYVDPKEGATEIGFRTNLPAERHHWRSVVTIGEWHQIAMRILWATAPDQGRVSVWFDGKQVMDDAPAQTKPNDNALFIQAGFHRDASQAPVEVIYLADAIEGSSLEDVMSPAASK